MWLVPVFSCLAVCCRWVEEASLVPSCLPSGLVVWCSPNPPTLIKKQLKQCWTSTAVGLTGSLSARLLVTNWALKQRGTLKGQRYPTRQAGWAVTLQSQTLPHPTLISGPRRTCWRQAALRPPPEAKIPLAPQHHSEGLSSLTRALRGLQSSTGHQSAQQ